MCVCVGWGGGRQWLIDTIGRLKPDHEEGSCQCYVLVAVDGLSWYVMLELEAAKGTGAVSVKNC